MEDVQIFVPDTYNYGDLFLKIQKEMFYAGLRSCLLT